MDDGWLGAARAIALHPAVLADHHAIEQFAEVLHHVVALGFTVDQHVEPKLLLEPDHLFDLLLHGLAIITRAHLALAQCGACPTDARGLGKGADGGGGKHRQWPALALQACALGIGHAAPVEPGAVLRAGGGLSCL